MVEDKNLSISMVSFMSTYKGAIFSTLSKLISINQADDSLNIVKTWDELSGNREIYSEFIRLVKNHRFNNDGKTIWFKSSDPYKKNKPFSIEQIGVRDDGTFVILVQGQQTKRIENKWTKRLGVMFDAQVQITWIGGVK